MEITREFLSDLYDIQKLSTKQICEILNLSGHSVLYKLFKKHNIAADRNVIFKEWKPEEIEFIKNNFEEHGAVYCAQHLNTTAKKVQYIASRNGLHYTERWTDEDVSFLNQNYANLGATLCSQKLGRNAKNVGTKASQLGLKKYVPIAKDGHQFCARCKEEKLLAEFGNSNRNCRGVVYYCKPCYSIIREEFKVKNPYRNWAQRTHSSHKRCGYKINCSSEDIEKLASESKNCPFCEKELNWNNNKMSHDSPSLDRLDNSEELNLSNIMVICQQCNSTKSNRSLDGFLEYCEKIIPNLKKIRENRENDAKKVEN